MAADGFFAQVNYYDSQGRLPIMDEAYPQHDGIRDAEAEATLMQLQQRLCSIIRASEDCVYKIGRVLDLEDRKGD